MQRYEVFKFNASNLVVICVNNMLYNIYLFFVVVFGPKEQLFYGC